MSFISKFFYLKKMAQGEYFKGFSTFKIEMVPEFDDRGNVDKFFRDVRQDGAESQGETFFVLRPGNNSKEVLKQGQALVDAFSGKCR